MAETSRALPRYIASGFYDKHIVNKKVVDIGVGRFDTHDGCDPICDWAEMHDKDICDATTMDAYADETFDTVYASHILEHLVDPVVAIKNWVRICKPGGIIYISIPHRDWYERKKTLPSKWNEDHKYFYLPAKSEPPCTFSFFDVIKEATDLNFHIATSNTSTNNDKLNEHANGEFSIEAIIYKKWFDNDDLENRIIEGNQITKMDESIYLEFSNSQPTIKVTSDNYKDLLESANKFYKTNFYKIAGFAFKKALELNQVSTEVLLNLARISFHERDYSNSVEYSCRAIEAEANHIEAYTILGKSMAALMQFGSAAECFSKAIILDASNANLYFELAKAESLDNNHQEALQQFKIAIAHDPKFVYLNADNVNVLEYFERMTA
jgi:SAM-dependent methyltransferase